MSQATYLVGDVFERMAELPDGSVDLVLTSPPFLALRSYLPADHPDKHKEIGQEPTPAEFLDTLLALTAEWRRVLAPHGSICVELGDTYAGSGGAGGEYGAEGMRGGQQGPGWPLAKSLCGIPHLYHLSLAYGRNLLRSGITGADVLTWVDDLRALGYSAEYALAVVGSWVAEHGDDHRFEPWRVRNVVAWCRPNPPVGALGDKFRPATSYLTIACVSQRRYFDLDAVREPVKHPNATHTVGNVADTRGDHGDPSKRIENHPGGAPPLDWWEIPTQPYKGSHYATYPEALCVRPIEAMCPRKVCRECGEPSQRTTLGWSDCGHDSWRPGVVLDPFAGSGTTLAVAVGHGRDAIGIDLDARNADLARERVGMFLTVEEPTKGAA